MSGTAGAIQFEYFPADNFRPHGTYAEIRPNQANSGQTTNRGLIIGQKLSAGTATANVAFLAFSRDQVNAACGAGSMAALMYAAWRKQDPYGEVWILPLADDPSGAAATGSISLVASSAQVGTIPLYLAGVNVPVAVNTADTATAIATAMVAAINATPGLPCTAAVDGTNAYQVDLTAIHKGLALNDIDIRFAYLGTQGGEQMPAGVTATVTAFSGGTQNPSLTTALANLPTRPYDYIALPYTDSASLTAIKTFLSRATGRWSPIKLLFGIAYTAYRGNMGALASFGTGQNGEVVDCVGFYDSPTPAWLEAADWAAVHARSLTINPAIPMQEVALNLLAPPEASRFDIGERNTLLYDGISTFTVQDDGTVLIDRSITMYQTNPSGLPDDSFLDIETMATLTYVLRYMTAQLATMFRRKILVPDGTRIVPGSMMASPSTVSGATIAIYSALAGRGLVTDVAAFEKGVNAQKVARGQVRVYLPITIADQLRQLALLVEFSK